MTAAKRGTAVGLPLCVFLHLFAVHRQRTATHTVKSTQARHTRVAQLVSLEIMDGTYESIYLVAFILAGPVYNNVLTNCAALLSPRGPSLALRAIHLVPRLRKLTHMCSRTISGTAYRFRHGSTLCSHTVEKILCRSPYFAAVTCRQSAPDSPKRKWELRG